MNSDAINFLVFYSKIKMLIQLKKIFLKAAHIVSAEIMPLESNTFSVLIETLLMSQGNKEVINIDFDDYEFANALISKIKKVLK